MTLQQAEELSKNMTGREAMKLLEEGIDLFICKPKNYKNNKFSDGLKNKSMSAI